MTSAIIVNYFASDVLEQCLKSLSASSEVILIDNSVDEQEHQSLEKLKQTFHFTLVCNKANLGFAKAVNQAARIASGETLLLINPDAFLVNDALNLLEAELNETIAIAGPRILYPDGKEQSVARRRTPSPKRSLIKFLGLARFIKDPLDYGPLPNSVQPVDALSGSCIIVRKKTFWELGGMDEAYRLHCEDLDFFKKSIDKGYQNVFVPEALVIHEKGHSSKRNPIWVSWHLHQGMLHYYQKFFRKEYSAFAWIFIVIAVYLRFVIHASLSSVKQAIA